MRFSQMALAATVTAALAVAPAVAQNFNLPPTFGTVNLQAGFMPDPHRTALQAGGPIRATSALGRDCTGNIAEAPDVRLNYSAGGFPLYIFARSSADTTLVVNLPDGSWICNDDFDGLNPGIVLNRPPSGQYDIWVGTWGGGIAPAELGISEIPPRR